MTDSIPTELQEQIQAIQALPGRVSLYFENLKNGVHAQYNSTLPTVAASVIKIPVMVEFFYQVSEGKLDIEDFIEINDFDKKPSCGALTYMHDGLKVTLLDLCTQMIILSDNTATNLLIRRLGMDHINRGCAYWALSERKCPVCFLTEKPRAAAWKITLPPRTLPASCGLCTRTVFPRPTPCFRS